MAEVVAQQRQQRVRIRDPHQRKPCDHVVDRPRQHRECRRWQDRGREFPHRGCSDERRPHEPPERRERR